MNYFFTKRHSRLLTTALAVCLVASMFSGCQKAKPEDTTPSTEEQLPSGLVEVKPTTEATTPTETTEPVNENLATVTKQLTVRSSPSTGAKIIGYLDPGTEVEIIKTETYMNVEWALIREGWIAMDSVQMNNGSSTTGPAETTPEATTPSTTEPNNTGNTGNTTKITGVVTSNGLFIRPDASTSGDPIGSYAKGTTITILETKNGWGRTDKGWVSMTYVNTTGNANTNTDTSNNNNNSTVTNGTTYFVTASELNVRDAAGINGNKVGTYTAGEKVVVTETSNGWGKTSDGWVSMQYLYKTGETGTNRASGIVTVDGLNIRSGPGTAYGALGSYKTGDRVNILEQIGSWGCTNKGWISMGYVYVDGTEGENSGTGTVTADDVNVRSGPGTQYEVLYKMNSGDTVEILEQFEIDGTLWGCTKDGWICMDYVGVG
ncbi:MAG: SH3 domain-containing protein [Faecousia sp.]